MLEENMIPRNHHQRGFDHTFSPEHQTTLSSAGLIYKHFGRAIIRKDFPQLEETLLDLVFEKLYENFVEAIDATDNGIEAYPEDIEPAFKQTTHLTARIRRMNPPWHAKNQHNDSKFKAAINVTGAEFMEQLKEIVEDWIPARKVVEDAIAMRFSVDSSGQILCLAQLCPWRDHLFTLEKELDLQPPIQFACYAGGSRMWRVQGVPLKPGGFQLRCGLRQEWRGLSDENLVKECGVEGAVFVHHNGWIGGNRTQSGAVEMARRSLQ
eukprot:TRINITY_DN12204_c0_g1_i1.p1 TRINITY_DN12204_c0_g1~~TRINITY_DN12204_c0_g1_i1.p1  ORF type:complete len:266 (-),score=41.86 TRINITY_DN12204_c0_g1_i1:96-893(-)